MFAVVWLWKNAEISYVVQFENYFRCNKVTHNQCVVNRLTYKKPKLARGAFFLSAFLLFVTIINLMCELRHAV